jgi:hypothetical protein
MKLQPLQNKVLRTTGKFPRIIQITDMHISFQIPYLFDYIIKLCGQQAQIIQRHENIKLQDKTPVRNNWQMCLLSVLIDHITCFGFYMWPSSGDFRDTKYQQ